MRYRYRSDDELKDSGVEWLGKIPKDWNTPKISSIIETLTDYVANGSFESLAKNVNYLSEEDYAILIRTQDNSNEFKGPFVYIDEKAYNFLSKSKVYPNDIIISNVGAVGNVFKAPNLNKPMSLAPNSILIRTTQNNQYIYYLLQSSFTQEEIRNIVSSTAQPKFNKTNFRGIKTITPSEVEQERIANFLDEKTSQFDLIISKKEKLIERLEESKKSLINEVVTGKMKVVKNGDCYKFIKRSSEEMKDSGIEWLGEIPKDWESIKIKRLSRIGRGASPRPIDNPIYFDEQGEYAWTRISDITSSDKYLSKTTQRVSELGASLSVKLEPNKLFLSIAATVGKPCITKIKACIHDGFVYFPDLKEYLNDYLYYIFYGGQCYKGLGKLGTQLNLNRETVGDIKIGLPNENIEVYYIIAFLEQELVKIDNLINKIKIQIEKLKEAKQSLISEAVTGKIEILD